MSKKTSVIHYNDSIKRMTIDMFLEGYTPEQIEKAIRAAARKHRSNKGAK